jgi:hypothetical protein
MACNILRGSINNGTKLRKYKNGVTDVSARWMKASKALKKDDQIFGQMVAEMAKTHSSEAFYALDDPLEAAVFSVLVELMKELEKAGLKFAIQVKTFFV